MKSLKYFVISGLLFSLLSCSTDKSSPSISDIDGNVYKTVKIGNQIWMAENLKVTHFNNGDTIPELVGDIQWVDTSDPAFCWYSNDTMNNEDYGILYNFHAMQTDKLCPEGWHVPDKKDYIRLISNMDPGADFEKHEASNSAGDKLKESGTVFWNEPNYASNKSGFSALPGGCRSWQGNFSMKGEIAYFGIREDNGTLALRASSNSAFLREDISSYVGVSVRCIKDSKE